MKRLVSPDRSKILYGAGNTAQLWIEDTRTHKRTKLFDIAKHAIGSLVR